jgi:hypothetical protein
MQFALSRPNPVDRADNRRRLRVTAMATPPITKTIEVRRRRRRASRRALLRAAWLAADLVAIGACAVLALRGLT